MSSIGDFGTNIKSIQRGAGAMNPGTSSSTHTITSVDTSKTVIFFHNMNNNHADSVSADDSHPMIVLTNATTVTRSRNSSGGRCAPSYSIVEFY